MCRNELLYPRSAFFTTTRTFPAFSAAISCSTFTTAASREALKTGIHELAWSQLRRALRRLASPNGDLRFKHPQRLQSQPGREVGGAVGALSTRRADRLVCIGRPYIPEQSLRCAFESTSRCLRTGTVFTSPFSVTASDSDAPPHFPLHGTNVGRRRR